MGRKTLEGVVAHDGRLEVLSQVETEPTSAGELTELVEYRTAHVCYWLRTLYEAGLVQTANPTDGDTSQYETDVDTLPSWIREEITRHREEKAGIAGPLRV